MSPKRTNGKVAVSPVKFNAGGNKAKSPSKNSKNIAAAKSSSLSPQDGAVSSKKNNSEDRNLTSTPPPTNNQTPSQPHNTYYQWVQSGLQKKKSPFNIKHWIATVLTLDGRDKFTKVLQYSCRLLGWYFAGLAVRTISCSGSVSTTKNNIGQMNSQLIYQAISQRFISLYKALVTSRKAFRMGRSVIEWDKIRSMGWGDYLGYWMCHPLAEEGGVSSSMDKEEEKEWRMMGGGGQGGQLLLRRDTHPIPEEDEHDDDVDDDDEQDDDDDDDDDNSWNGQEPSIMEEKKDDPQQQLSSTKVVSRPGRPILPSRVSSNIGWGPSNTTTTTTTTTTAAVETSSLSPSPPSRTVSEMGRQMYRPYPSQSSFGSYQQLKGTTSTLAKQPPTTPTTPGWKLIGGTLKLLGLMGFWTFDNLSFLTSSGFLDPITTTKSSGGGGGDSKSSIATLRTKRKQRASEYAARCYFMGGLAGLYVNLRSFWIHRNGPLMEARRKCLDESSTSNNNKDDDGSSSSSSAQLALKKTEQKHFELFLALLKSICDVTVFSNNPGVDLHLKLRGKKNHEGLHCLCGLISAGTVLYNNFPNAE